jgi:hypothetical protein
MKRSLYSIWTKFPLTPTSVAARITVEMTNMVAKIGQDSPLFR